MISGLGSLLALGALCSAAVEWLCRRSRVWFKLAGVSLAMLVALYCCGVALMLVVGSVDAGESPRLPGVLSVLAFTTIACAAVVSATLGLRYK
jgi:hypothetical protein